MHQVDALSPHVEELPIGGVTERALDPLAIPVRRVLGALGERPEATRTTARVEGATCGKPAAKVRLQSLEAVVQPPRPTGEAAVLKLDELLDFGVGILEEFLRVQLLIALGHGPRRRWR